MENIRADKQDYVFMQQALQQAAKALEQGEFPVGCIISLGDEVLAEGNRENSGGFSNEERIINEIDHAEIIALRRLQSSLSQRATTIGYANLSVYSTMEPCLMCYSTLLVNGIRRIVYAYEDAMGGGTNLQLDSLNPLYRTIEVEIVAGVMRSESLALFKEFFSSPNTIYLKESYLKQYTLQQ